jgi:perosamine synthetase
MNQEIQMACIQLNESEINAATEVLRSGALRQGSQCDNFEAEFCYYTGAKYGVTSSNGSSALHLAYMAFLEPGDEVLVPSFTFIATGSMVSAAGGVPVFCDVDADNFLLDLDDARAKITNKTKAIAPVHLFGNVVDIEKVLAFAKEFGLKVVWDAAQAHGAQYNGQDIGCFGDFVTYSFYPSKNMFVGEGGITMTNNPDYAHRMRFQRSHGQTGKYLHTMFGLNYRMTDVEAAIGREQLKRLGDMLTLRKRNAEMLNECVAQIPWLKAQTVEDSVSHAWHQYCVVIDEELAGFNREDLQGKLKEAGIPTGVHYPRGLHQQPIFIEEFGEQNLPVTEKLSKTILALPVHHGLTIEQVEHITTTLKSFA